MVFQQSHIARVHNEGKARRHTGAALASVAALLMLSSCGDQSASLSSPTAAWSSADAAHFLKLKGEQSERSRYVVDGSIQSNAKILSEWMGFSAQAFMRLQVNADAKEFKQLGMSSLWLTPDERDALTNSGRVKFVSPVTSVHLIEPVAEDQAPDVQAVQPISWGLDRIDQASLPLDGTYTPPAGSGQNVWAYVIDTGIDGAHPDFAGRVAEGFSSINDSEGTFDCQGHGTHVAGTIAGNSYGVAPEAQLVPVRVLDCTGSGTTDGVIAGIEYVLTQKKAHPNRPMVANMSLGGFPNSALDAATSRLVQGGVFLAVAAGNESQDACKVSPARAPDAFTTGATESNDNLAAFSNTGSCVDVYAPVARILSAKPNNQRAYLSGTSMASPHVAGVGALVLAAAPRATPTQVGNRILELSLKGAVGGVEGSKAENRMLQAETRPAQTEPEPEPIPAPPVPTPAPGVPSKIFESRVAQGQSEQHTWRLVDTPSGEVTVQASLYGPSGAEFSLTLQRWNFETRGWENIQSSRDPGANDTITWQGQREGGFRFSVQADRGQGAYTLVTTISRNR
jgi:subtilisin family serine protease